MAKKIKGKSIAKQLNEDCSSLIGMQMKQRDFVQKYGQAIHDTMMANFGDDMRKVMVQHRDNISEENEELMKELKPLWDSLDFFCAAYD